MPERVPAGSARAANCFMLSGVDELDGERVPFGVLFTGNGAGFGAAYKTDGWPLAQTNSALGGVKIPSIEQLELLYPVRVEQHEIEPNSMGFGEWIGGPGNRMTVRPLCKGETIVISIGDGMANPPHGALGGTPGIGGGQYIQDERTGHRRYTSVTSAVRLRGDEETWTGVSSGGGGFGHPCDRNPDAVRRDVRDGIISRGVAQTIFGVVLSNDDDPDIDEQATRQTRAKLRKRPRAMLDPQVPDASTWRTDDMRPGDIYLLNPRL
jgi:N-methylhydantoinase B